MACKGLEMMCTGILKDVQEIPVLLKLYEQGGE